MNNLKRIMRRRALVSSMLLAVALALGAFLGVGTKSAFAQNLHGRVQWDIVNVLGGVAPGGTASALAADGSMITLTGSGTFIATPPTARFSAIAMTGGGTWQTVDPTGATGSGTYTVLRGPASFHVAPGALPPSVTDLIGDPAKAHSGLARFDIQYSDGSRGWIVVSCHLPVGSPPTVFEGITASKDFVGYWNRVAPMPGVEGNRTVFHALTP